MCGLLHSDHHGGSLDHGESLDTDVETEGLGGSGGDGGDDLFAGGGLKGHFGGNGALLDGNDFASRQLRAEIFIVFLILIGVFKG